jgi:hypothetical protein
MTSGDDDLEAELAKLRDTTPAPGDDFAGRLMRQVALRPRPRRSWWQTLWATRTITIRVRPGAFISAAAIVVVALSLTLRTWPSRNAPVMANASHPRDTTDPQDAAHSQRVLVRFALRAEDARRVSLAGDFNGWRADDIALTRGPDGMWTATVPLDSGSWSYSFVVDGKWVTDPTADAWREDGFGGRNAVVRIGS